MAILGNVKGGRKVRKAGSGNDPVFSLAGGRHPATLIDVSDPKPIRPSEFNPDGRFVVFANYFIDGTTEYGKSLGFDMPDMASDSEDDAASWFILSQMFNVPLKKGHPVIWDEANEKRAKADNKEYHGEPWTQDVERAMGDWFYRWSDMETSSGKNAKQLFMGLVVQCRALEYETGDDGEEYQVINYDKLSGVRGYVTISDPVGERKTNYVNKFESASLSTPPSATEDTQYLLEHPERVIEFRDPPRKKNDGDGNSSHMVPTQAMNMAMKAAVDFAIGLGGTGTPETENALAPIKASIAEHRAMRFSEISADEDELTDILVGAYAIMQAAGMTDFSVVEKHADLPWAKAIIAEVKGAEAVSSDGMV